MSKIIDEEGLKVQISDDNKVLTDGVTYATKVYLGEGAAEWQEIDESEIPKPEVVEVIEEFTEYEEITE